jgi:hypothetical protein
MPWRTTVAALWLTASLIAYAVNAAVPVVPDAPIAADPTRVAVSVSVAFVSNATAHDAADLAALALAGAPFAETAASPFALPLDAYPEDPQAVSVPVGVSAVNVTTTALPVAAMLVPLFTEQEARANAAALERAVGRDVGALVLRTSPALREALAMGTGTGGSLTVRARLVDMFTLSGPVNTSTPLITVAAFSVIIDLSHLDPVMVAAHRVGTLIVSAFSDAVFGLGSDATTLRGANSTILHYNLTHRMLNITTGAEKAFGASLATTGDWLSGAASRAAVVLSSSTALANSSSALISRLRVLANATGSAAAVGSSLWAGGTNASLAQRLMRSAYLIDGRDGAGPAWGSGDVLAVQAAVLTDVADTVGWRPLGGALPAAVDLGKVEVAKNEGAVTSARALVTMTLYGATAAELAAVGARLSGSRFRLTRASEALRSRLGTTRLVPVDMLVLRTESEARGLPDDDAGRHSGCSHLGCWVPIVLWCGVLLVTVVVVAVAATGRAATATGESEPAAGLAAVPVASMEEYEAQDHGGTRTGGDDHDLPVLYTAPPTAVTQKHYPELRTAATSTPVAPRQAAGTNTQNMSGTMNSRSSALIPRRQDPRPRIPPTYRGNTTTPTARGFRLHRPSQALEDAEFGTAVASEPGEQDVTTSASSAVVQTRRGAAGSVIVTCPEERLSLF